MASAPAPGVGAHLEATEAAKVVMRLRLKDKTWDFAMNNVPLREKIACRKATGLPYEAFLGDDDKIGEDSVVVLWWLARRANGEHNLTFDVACGEWPSPLAADDLDVDVITPDESDDSPEA